MRQTNLARSDATRAFAKVILRRPAPFFLYPYVAPNEKHDQVLSLDHTRQLEKLAVCPYVNLIRPQCLRGRKIAQGKRKLSLCLRFDRFFLLRPRSPDHETTIYVVGAVAVGACSILSSVYDTNDRPVAVGNWAARHSLGARRQKVELGIRVIEQATCVTSRVTWRLDLRQWRGGNNRRRPKNMSAYSIAFLGR